LSLAALIKDLGRPARFASMLRVFKPTSPMNIGTWLLTGYGPAALTAAGCELTGWFPRIGRAATVGAALAGPAVAAYTAVLISDTAVPAWHDAHRVMPFLFTSSAASAAAGLGLACAGPGEAGPAARLAVFGTAGELIAEQMLERELEPVVYQAYQSSRTLKLGKILAVAGATAGIAGTALDRSSRLGRVIRTASGLSLLAGSALTRFGVFHAGMASARDPRATVDPQRERLGSASAASAAH
jgi:formate-dependent nitrite reductase membrane component NrfD